MCEAAGDNDGGAESEAASTVRESGSVCIVYCWVGVRYDRRGKDLRVHVSAAT
jgi:hypothetical protein